MVPAAHVQKQTGLSLASYIRARRLYLAAFALRFTQKSILDISVEYQFDNQQTFSRCFKKHFAESPSVYRHARKQDFSNLVRSLAASQPGDIQVERVSIARGQYAFHGKQYAYHRISRSWTSRTCHSAARCGGNSIPCWASARRKPIRLPSWCRTASGSGSIIPRA